MQTYGRCNPMVSVARCNPMSSVATFWRRVHGEPSQTLGLDRPTRSSLYRRHTQHVAHKTVGSAQHLA